MEHAPTQEARRLVERFYFALPNNGSQTGINNVHSRWEEAKQCAKITAETAQKLQEGDADRYQYWQQVEQEIGKL